MASAIWEGGVRVAAACLLALFASSCAKHVSAPAVERLTEAVDSAYRAVWLPSQTVGDTTHHTAFYDSVVAYVRQGLPIEAEKRAYAKDLIDLAPLLPMNLSERSRRAKSEAVLVGYDAKQAQWSEALDSVFGRYSMFVRRTLDTLYRKDTTKYAPAQGDLFRRDLFTPVWRPRYDSIESQVVLQTLTVLRFLDSNAAAIEFDTTLRFEDEALSARYSALTSRLDSLSSEESRVAAEASSMEGGAGGKHPDPEKHAEGTPLPSDSSREEKGSRPF